MEELVICADRCKGCGYCVEGCPRGALYVRGINGKGYQFVNVDREKCVACGICYVLCPDCAFEIVPKGDVMP
ncbi:MAG: 4Fe-4S binding protein [Synergistaceae bacterium]|jgi:2-oxoglutarate ferredoxin oxidoreductase subunit delta|nr:4Fe-4S binding protein [Synergistaceae bacterium]